MALTMTFRMDHGMTINCPYANSNLMAILMLVSPLLSFVRYSQWKFAGPLAWPLEWAKVKCKYANSKAMCEFLFAGNINVCPICHHFRHSQSKCAWFRQWLSEWTKVKCKYSHEKNVCDFLMLAIAKLAVSVTVCEIFSVDMCMTLTLTLRIEQD